MLYGIRNADDTALKHTDAAAKVFTEHIRDLLPEVKTCSGKKITPT